LLSSGAVATSSTFPGHRTAIRLLLPVAAALTIAASDARAGEAERIAVGEVSVARPVPGVDPATLKSAAEGEIRTLDERRIRGHKRYVLSLAVVRSSDGPVSCEITAMLRERKSGSMLAVIEGRARAEGGADPELRRAVLRAAVRTAVRQIPDAITGGS
jgi:hypothetical protein